MALATQEKAPVLISPIAERKKVIAIDARIAGASAGHGIARYVYELLIQIMNLKSDIEFILLVNKDSPFLRQKLPANFRLRIMHTSWISVWGNLELAWVLKRLKPDLFHSPSFMAPMFVKIPQVNTIHDLNHVALSENYSWAHKFYYNVYLLKKLQNARKVITVSNFSKSEILNFFRLPERRVQVIYNGVSPRFAPSEMQDPKVLEHVRIKYELPENYILSIGNKKPHKNIARLVEAYCRGNFSEPLVLRSEFDPELLALAERFNKKHAIHFLRFVSYDELPYLYCLARVFVYPSYYEGFGLPPVEAAASGVPVVVSNCSSLPEVMRDSAFYMDPKDPDDIARGIRAALDSKTPKSTLVQQGRTLTERYSWERVSEETLALYNELLETKGATLG